MAVEMEISNVNDRALTPATPRVVDLEQQLDDYIESDPTILGQPVLIIGRQIHTTGGPLNLLVMDSTGALHVIELKQDKTPRDVAAQVLDCGSWVAQLSNEDVQELYDKVGPKVAFDQVYADLFGQAPPEDMNTEQVFTTVAKSLDLATERIVRCLSETYDLPINAVLFRHFEDGKNFYLARTWLIEQEATALTPRKRRTRETWKHRDWAVTFGMAAKSRQWDDAAEYGFVPAGGGRWYAQTLRNLTVGARIFVNVRSSGYVGIGKATGGAEPFDEAAVEADGQERLLSGLELNGKNSHPGDDPDNIAEWLARVEWIATMPEAGALCVKGMRGNQNSSFKMYEQFTIDQVYAKLGVEA